MGAVDRYVVPGLRVTPVIVDGFAFYVTYHAMARLKTRVLPDTPIEDMELIQYLLEQGSWRKIAPRWIRRKSNKELADKYRSRTARWLVIDPVEVHVREWNENYSQVLREATLALDYEIALPVALGDNGKYAATTTFVRWRMPHPRGQPAMARG